jgi:hypothetical protein
VTCFFAVTHGISANGDVLGFRPSYGKIVYCEYGDPGFPSYQDVVDQDRETLKLTIDESKKSEVYHLVFDDRTGPPLVNMVFMFSCESSTIPDTYTVSDAFGIPASSHTALDQAVLAFSKVLQAKKGTKATLSEYVDALLDLMNSGWSIKGAVKRLDDTDAMKWVGPRIIGDPLTKLSYVYLTPAEGKIRNTEELWKTWYLPVGFASSEPAENGGGGS